jgi:hypothetical protein
MHLPLPIHPAAAEPGKAGHWQGLQVLARGSNRLCAIDPDSPDYCLKFELPRHERRDAGMRQKAWRWLAARLPSLGDNHSELRAWRRLRARLGAATDGVLAEVHGVESTPWGNALRCDCLRLTDGSPARSLFHHLFEDPCYSAEDLCVAVDRLEHWLLLHEVPLFDLNAGNFVVQPRADGLHLVCIDVKSVVRGKEIVPVSRWIRPLGQRKINRRATRLRQRINAALPDPPQLAGRGRAD